MKERFIVKEQPPLWITKDGIEIESSCHDLFDSCTNKKICQFEYNTDTEKIINLLNQLNNENHQLKKQIDNLEHTKNFCAECCEQVEKENKQLKSEIKKIRKEYKKLWMDLHT